ncbi:SAC domain-containing protein [Caenorhabditis elegans]|uniref:SAC domain-containing protein n=1 Tax=Caenorhabditis elegans TaxID=6239 RepID=P90770_CAEEL|nr:SAC domain-containing protein [Caenorhabditis elegans]CAB05701.2 SAC domain-containing protein [Caenorhabditis elegans]|eukprot:NP_492266.2 Uncharacterized protein CELE_C34B7.2 [Caenorhabditis elegans]
MPCRLRKITVYETKSRFYIIGCDSTGSRYNVLKIDRIDPKALITGEPEYDYTREEILELLATISDGSSVVYRSSSKKGTKSGLIERATNAFGILGCVRFVEGYYLIIITRAHAVATLGYHPVYKIVEVAMIPIAMDGVSTSSEEQKYVKLFQSVDLSTDFYFSYSYDMSRTFQENSLRSDWNNHGQRRLEADERFVWNSFLLEPLRKNLISERWFVEIVHGYVRQEYIFLPIGRISLTIIGRRSTKYAGTRFLKRGANPTGNVANYVETEQIVWDMASSGNVADGRFSSFVQMRGSVPMRWSQDPSTRGVVGKPLILIDNHEPHAQTAASHFRDVRNKYGNPIVIMNLIKRNEKRRHEGVLHTQFLKNIEYLNQFLPNEEKLCYISFDVARCNKAANSMPSINVLNVMEDLSMKSILKNGWFQSFPLSEALKIRPREAFATLDAHHSKDGRFMIQHGICRTNCVDCLDRTNVAQFVIAKVALGCQLCAMGILDEPNLTLQSEVCRLLEDMFDEHGDTMALQYAGSQLVHSIKTYKKTAAFQERRRDVFQTLSRYYSNTFNDWDKQMAINLFLGVFRPRITTMKNLWDLTSDYNLHFPYSLKINTDYCAWTLSEKELEDLVFLDYDESENSDGYVEIRSIDVDGRRGSEGSEYRTLLFSSHEDFRDYHRTYEFTSLDDRIGRLFSIENRAIQVDGINEEPTTHAQFLKLWKTTETKEKDQKKPNKKDKEEKESDDEDDDEEISTQWSDVVEAQQEWYDLVNAPGNVTTTLQKSPTKRESTPPRNTSRAKRSLLSTGLQFAKDIYHLDHLKTQPEERRYYEKYAITAFKCNVRDWEKVKPTLLSEFKITSEVEPRRPTFFTTDDCYRTESPEVSGNSARFYIKSSHPLTTECSAQDYGFFSKYMQAT